MIPPFCPYPTLGSPADLCQRFPVHDQLHAPPARLGLILTWGSAPAERDTPATKVRIVLFNRGVAPIEVVKDTPGGRW